MGREEREEDGIEMIDREEEQQQQQQRRQALLYIPHATLWQGAGRLGTTTTTTTLIPDARRGDTRGNTATLTPDTHPCKECNTRHSLVGATLIHQHVQHTPATFVQHRLCLWRDAEEYTDTRATQTAQHSPATRTVLLTPTRGSVSVASEES
ncbi:hypothetical protein E2C01_039638 [Portunus trituberculatus]|uniref:Uncharacterized protein n=1 Tax=Portunus trituberculatus TaxID=210409 RepID=A0A5B7FHD2_PORTR|nr:hypothetical protein [Portunus trituberculatus]